jgi:hypothetical protein
LGWDAQNTGFSAKEGLMLIMPHSIVGLSVMRQPLLQKLNLRNETQTAGFYFHLLFLLVCTSL